MVIRHPAPDAGREQCQRPRAPARCRTLGSMDAEWSDPEFLRASSTRRAIVRKPLTGIITGYHVLPYILVGARARPRRPARSRCAGRIKVSPAPGDRAGRRRPDLRRAVRRARADGSAAGRPRVQLPLRLPGGAGERGPRDPAPRARRRQPPGAGARRAVAAGDHRHGRDRLAGRALLPASRSTGSSARSWTRNFESSQQAGQRRRGRPASPACASKPASVARSPVLRLTVAGEGDQHRAAAAERAQAPRDLVAVEPGQADVHQRDVGVAWRARSRAPCGPSPAASTACPSSSRSSAQRVARVGVVLDDQDRAAGGTGAPVGRQTACSVSSSIHRGVRPAPRSRCLDTPHDRMLFRCAHLPLPGGLRHEPQNARIAGAARRAVIALLLRRRPTPRARSASAPRCR